MSADPWDCRFCGSTFDDCEQSGHPCCGGCLDAPNGGHLTEDGKAPSLTGGSTPESIKAPEHSDPLAPPAGQHITQPAVPRNAPSPLRPKVGE